MIDTYFKEKFDIYLQQEFKKNPRMREHVETEEKLSKEIVRNKVDEEPAGKESPISPIDRQQESCQRLGDLGDEVCSMDGSIVENMAAGDDTVTGSASLLTKGEATIDDNRSGESEVIDKKGATLTRSLVEEVSTKDVSANEKSLQPALIEAEIVKEASGENVTPKTANPEVDFSKVTRSQIDDPAAIIAESKQLTQKKKNQLTLLRKKSSLSPKVEEANEVNEKKKKQRFKTIFFTEKDFRDAKIHGGWKDYDFMEFDDEDEDADRASPEGILVSQLPFKPRADIGKLERVTEDEFCPLTLEDEADCDEVRIWP